MALTVVVLTVAVACGGPQSPSASPDGTPTAAATATTAASAATETPTAEPCAHGNLRIGNLPLIDQRWQDGLERAVERAQTWQSDAMLTSFRIGCEVLGPGFRWQATFYSPSLQAYFASDTGETISSEIDPRRVSPLPTDSFSFALLRRSLTKAGYDDATELSVSTGIEIRLNSSTIPFGPPDAPTDVVLYHVAVLHRGEVRDLFVGSEGGAIYQYSF